jgi:hypothetical protein
MIGGVAEGEPMAGRPMWDLHVLTLALESMEQDLEAATDPSEHRELTEQIRILAARIDRLIGLGPQAD